MLPGVPIMEKYLMKTHIYIILMVCCYLCYSTLSAQEIQVAQENVPQATERVVKITPKMNEQARQSLNRMAFQFLREGPMLNSPYGLTILLGVLREGAVGETREEISQFLGTELPGEAFMYCLSCRDKDGKPQVEVFNGAFVAQDFQIREEYASFIRDICGQYLCTASEILSADFRKKPGESVKMVNQWFAEKSGGKHKEVLENVSPQTQLLLVNQVNFEQNWLYSFKRQNTKMTDFYPDPDYKIQLPMMNMTQNLPYASLWDMELLVLPYRNETAMLVILPKNNAGLEYICTNLDENGFQELIKQLRYTQVKVSLPKFKDTMRCSMISDLQEMGLQKPFAPDSDFSNIAGKDDLVVSEIIQEVTIDVNEEGTTATAATAAQIVYRSAFRKEIPHFNANHPFIYMIITNDWQEKTPAILFSGVEGAIR